MKKIIDHTKSVFKTPWFELIAKTLKGEPDAPYYSLKLTDYVSVIATTADDKIVFVKQYRPAVEQITLEIPSGNIDPGESAEESAKRELLEETGYFTQDFTLIGSLLPDTGRLGNKIWGYRAKNVVKKKDFTPEPGIEVVLLTRKQAWQKLQSGEFNHALHLALFFLDDFWFKPSDEKGE